ncbi:MAG: hypothetical protein GY791_10785 [Alphaproteobacteria bacterium]|nr:hypothetical protein [Alphaproteobacteria bacterium]
MTKSGILVAGLAVYGLSLLGGPAAAEDMALTVPNDGDPVVVYTNRFKPEHFEAGKKLVIEGFSKAMADHGKDRLTFFLVHEDASEVVTVSIFLNGTDVDRWHDAMGRQEVVKKLNPLRRQPLILQEFEFEELHVVDP